MFRKLAGAALAAFVAVQPVHAEEERSLLGFGYLLVNDTFGDSYDRWRTGSAVASLAVGSDWTGQAPSELGDLWEVRFGGEIIAPISLGRQRSWDRHYASSAFLGAHTHIQRGGLEASIGADVVAIGPMTNLDEIQAWIHRNADVQLPSQAVLDAQIQNTWRLRGVVEVGNTVSLGNAFSLRPFAEVRAGDETLARVGFDATLGGFGQGELLARDSVTGHRYSVIRNQQPGWSVVVGADAAQVVNSVYLPEVNGLERTDVRARARAGVHWRGKRHSVFYGVSWLGKEFKAQTEGQVVGAINFTYQF
ncbi:lipid A-modifier LpxR family protein [Shimia sp.]|uniref:lipid A-modifier LpxR family protein n=1 Tax=Shimia sp. TaxID=1954381 RepID=UPI003B8DB20C